MGKKTKKHHQAEIKQQQSVIMLMVSHYKSFSQSQPTWSLTPLQEILLHTPSKNSFLPPAIQLSGSPDNSFSVTACSSGGA